MVFNHTNFILKKLIIFNNTKFYNANIFFSITPIETTIR